MTISEAAVLMRREKIVVIEDESDILEVIAYNLSRQGYKVRAAQNGDEGLKMVRQEGLCGWI